MRNFYYKLPLRHKRGLWGVIFMLPWFIGFLLFFARPFVETVLYSFSDVAVHPIEGIERVFIGFANYTQAFTVDPHFNRYIITLAFPALAMVVIVVIFSLLSAMLINGKYFGRGIVRAVFFIPIIMGANIAVAAIAGDDVVTQATTASLGFGGFSSQFLIEILNSTGLPTALTSYVTQAITGIFGVLAQSGVPILIFLAGLQSISPAMYEVAKIEGATGYETFWKVTLPMISPMILLSTVYTIVDMFVRHAIVGPAIPGLAAGGTPVPFLQYIRHIGFISQDYGLASAMSVVYILACLLVIVIVTAIMSKGVFYYD